MKLLKEDINEKTISKEADDFMYTYYNSLPINNQDNRVIYAIVFGERTGTSGSYKYSYDYYFSKDIAIEEYNKRLDDIEEDRRLYDNVTIALREIELKEEEDDIAYETYDEDEEKTARRV